MRKETAAVTDPHVLSVRSADPVATVEAAATLLRTGRTTMALTLLEDLPALIRAALAAAKPSPTSLQLAEAELARMRSHVRALSAESARLRDEQRRAEADLVSRRREL